MDLLKGKKALILGAANDRSIAWGMAEVLHREGAKIGLTYVNDAIHKRIVPLAEKVNAQFLTPLDVTQDSHYQALKDVVQKEWGTFDVLIHSIAFANGEDLKRPFSETSKEGFQLAMDVSVYSFIKLCGLLKDCLNPRSSVMALTYYGSEKVIPNYNIMGVAKAALESSVRYLAQDLGKQKIRVNAISSGPIKTLAASGVSGFRDILKVVEEKSPMGENVTTEDVGQLALFLSSTLSERITGQILYVDSGQSIMGL
jgi:enoyl-[acyl-carrier protein] reductase I